MRSLKLLAVIYADYSEALTTLLRYPGPTSHVRISIPLLLSQAVLLRDSAASPATGISIVMQNQKYLQILPNPPPPSANMDDPRRRPRAPPPKGPPLGSGSGFGLIAGQRLQQAQMGLAGLGLPEMARGLIDRGREMGIDKAILSRVTEIRVSVFFAVGDVRFLVPSPD